MKQLLVEIDDQTAAKLERVAPARSRKRSEFVRQALRRALWDEEERATSEAYRRVPDDESEAYVASEVWEPRAKRPRVKR
jgi:metal-responsive CopG/Arc/MetJ family transcriptional regulator